MGDFPCHGYWWLSGLLFSIAAISRVAKCTLSVARSFVSFRAFQRDSGSNEVGVFFMAWRPCRRPRLQYAILILQDATSMLMLLPRNHGIWPKQSCAKGAPEIYKTSKYRPCARLCYRLYINPVYLRPPAETIATCRSNRVMIYVFLARSLSACWRADCGVM